jgi:hypothetical protein
MPNSDQTKPIYITPLYVGSILYGFCGGCFGRDSYANKRVEAFGADWVVAREEGPGDFGSGGSVVFADVSPSELVEYLTPEKDTWE